MVRPRAISVLLTAFGICGVLCGQSQVGTVCITPISLEPPTWISPGGNYNPATLSVKIDNGKLLSWPHQESRLVGDLKLNERHVISVWSDGRRIQSLRFRFSEFGTDLCLSYDAYALIQLRERTSSRSCKCK